MLGVVQNIQKSKNVLFVITILTVWNIAFTMKAVTKSRREVTFVYNYGQKLLFFYHHSGI